MDERAFTDLQDLVGFWSCLAFIAGFVGVGVRHFAARARDSKLSVKISSAFAAGMFLFSLFVGLFVLPASMAHGGPVPSEVRHIWRYDKYFAALIALVFAAVFVYDLLRFQGGSHRAGVAGLWALGHSTVKRTATFPLARLSTGGVLWLGLIAWHLYWSYDSMPDQPNTRDGWGGYPPVFLVSAAFFLSVIIISIPALCRGTWPLRCVAAILAAFPLLTFILVVWWVLDFAL